MRILLLLAILLPTILTAQEPRIKNKKYQGLLWEISGNGLHKPSYLFGTMHVSNKVAFHLADSFYLGIKSADIVALETNPETWQQEMSEYSKALNKIETTAPNARATLANGFFVSNTFKYFKYEKWIENVLQMSPANINSLLYRSYGNNNSDFEEDTYLDLYLFQCGKRWGKQIVGVEDYNESMLLMAEAYRDAENDKNKRRVTYDRQSGFSSDRLQESYRTGNLDWLDSINYYNSTSAAFDEKFMYKRNEIQAHSIDTIIRKGLSLFVGVGAAHLPGERGVIEMLRAKGYKLRPVQMGARDSEHKSFVEKIRVPLKFNPWKTRDGLITAMAPGELLLAGEEPGIEQYHFADMANGSYYLLTRMMTSAWLWNHTAERVHEIVDSLLYENIPGKIISRKNITRNGLQGIEVINRTRRGDMQRYQIYTSPFELLVFKMSGIGDYVTEGTEADTFFNSITISNPTSEKWIQFSPANGGFSVDLPHPPYIGNDGSWIFDAYDPKLQTNYRVVRSDIHNYFFAEVDSFDLGLMEESFALSEFIEKRISRKNGKANGYPTLDVEYKDKSGKLLKVRFLLKGPHYYALVARASRHNHSFDQFINSFKIKDIKYGPSLPRVDTAMHFSVNSPVFPELDSMYTNMPIIRFQKSEMDKKIDWGGEQEYTRRLKHDSTGELITIRYEKASPYISPEKFLEENSKIFRGDDSTWIVRKTSKNIDNTGFTQLEWLVSDTASSRLLWMKRWVKGNARYDLFTLIDTLSTPGSFIKDVYSSFQPVDSAGKMAGDASRLASLFKDFYGGDSTVRRRAIKGVGDVKIDSSNFQEWKTAINSIEWKEKDYLSVKTDFIQKLEDIKTKEVSDWLVQMYHVAGDTIELQNVALETLLRQRTAYSYEQFRKILSEEPPIPTGNSYYRNPGFNAGYNSRGVEARRYRSVKNGRFFDELTDSLLLTKAILPDLLPLINLSEYKDPVISILKEMLDSNVVTAADYEGYFSKFFLEARMEYRQMLAKSRTKAMEDARKEEEGRLDYYYNNSNSEFVGDIPDYLELLIPFWGEKPAVKEFVTQVANEGDLSLRFAALKQLVKKGQPVSAATLDTLAANVKYRYRLYSYLTNQNKIQLFPARYNNQKDLAESRIYLGTYTKVDSLVYLDKVLVDDKGRKGYVYFFKYLSDKKGNAWKLATVGLVPVDPKKFVFDGTAKKVHEYFNNGWKLVDDVADDTFTELSSTRWVADDPLKTQIEKQIRKMKVKNSRSGQRFYDSDEEY